MKIGIVGLGLMGGSAAKAILARSNHTVYGADQCPDTLKKAMASGVIHKTLTKDNLAECHLIFLALYPQAAIDYLTDHGPYVGKDAVVIDFCGVKRTVCSALREIARQHGFCYIGGHPMAGTEQSGFDASFAGLFQNASMILTPVEEIAGPVLETLEALFRAMGFGTIQITDPETHDRMIAYTSQLAHVLSSAYIKSPAALSHRGFSAGSFKDMTRVAWLNEEMWTELFLANGDYLTEEIEGLASRLLAYSQAIRAKDAKELLALLAQGRRCKENVEQGS